MRKIILAGLLCAVSHLAVAGDDLARFFHVKSYRAHFDQVVVDSDGRETQRASGDLWIQRPNKFRWDYAAPYEQHIVGDGKKVWIYDVGLEQVTVRSMAAALGDTPAVLLAGTGNLADTFIIKESPRATPEGMKWVQLKPKVKDSGFDRIRLGFGREHIARIELVDGFGQTTRIALSDYRANIKIEPAQFQFTPPAGVDVLEQ